MCVSGKNLLWSQGHANWVVWGFWDEMTKVTTSFEGFFFFSPPWAWGRGLGVPPNGRADSTWYVSYSGLKVMGVCSEQHRESATRPPVSSMAVSRQLLRVGMRVVGGNGGHLRTPALQLLNPGPQCQSILFHSHYVWVLCGPLMGCSRYVSFIWRLKTSESPLPERSKKELTSRTRIHPGALFPPPANSVYIIPFLCLHPRKGIWEMTYDFSLACKMHTPSRSSTLWI